MQPAHHEDHSHEVGSFLSSYVSCRLQMLGINIFTVILAVLIVFFLSMNAVLGPGWLGSTLGIPGTGNIEEVSPNLPGSLDLNRPEYRL
eukprot:jgi/Psemu1/299875/fgenesh1_kg.3_\